MCPPSEQLPQLESSFEVSLWAVRRPSLDSGATDVEIVRFGFG